MAPNKATGGSFKTATTEVQQIENVFLHIPYQYFSFMILWSCYK